MLELDPSWNFPECSRGLIQDGSSSILGRCCTHIYRATSTIAVARPFVPGLEEVFLLGGAQKATITILPEYALDTLIVKTAGLNIGAKVSVTAWGLEGGWKAYENATGTVVGNVTMEVKRDRLGYMQFDRI